MAVIKGIQTVDSVLVINTDVNPTMGGGTVAPIGTLALASDGSGTFTKTGALDTDWSANTSAPYLGVVRYVYLVNDASDATKLGGSANNVYTTFQSAYDGANTLQTTLGGSNKVVIIVGVTTSAVVGNLALTADWNNNVVLQGLSQISSVVGNIDGSNASGNGRNIGASIGNNIFRAYNIKLGNINTNATGATGNSGRFSCVVSNIAFGNIDTSITNVANATGNGGLVRIQTLSFDGGVGIGITSITTSSQATTSNAGAVTITGSIFGIGTITTANNNKSGTINITSNYFGGGSIGNIVLISTNNTSSTLENLACDDIIIEGNGASGSWTALTTNCDIATISVINNDGTNKGTYTFNGCRIEQYASNDDIITLMQNCGLEFINFLGSNSKLYNVSIIQGNAPDPCIKGIGSNCYLYNCSLVKESAGDCLDNFSNPVNLNYYNTSFSSSIDNAIILIEDNGIPYLPDAGGGDFTFNGVENSAGVIDLNGGTAGANVLNFENLVDNRRYLLVIINETGTDTLSFVDGGGATILIEGGSYTPTASAGAIDRLEVEFSKDGFILITPNYNYS